MSAKQYIVRLLLNKAGYTSRHVRLSRVSEKKTTYAFGPELSGRSKSSTEKPPVNAKDN